MLFEYEADLSRLPKNLDLSGQTIVPSALAVFGLYFGGAPFTTVDKWYGCLPRLAVDGPENATLWHSIAAVLLATAILLAPISPRHIRDACLAAISAAYRLSCTDTGPADLQLYVLDPHRDA
jgi:hypothetical protein